MNETRIRIGWGLIGVALVALIFLFRIVEHQDANFRRALQQELSLRNAFAKSEVAAIFVDADQRITFLTPGFTKMMGYEPGDLIGKNIREIMTDNCRSLHEKEAPKLKEGERNAVSFTCHIKAKGGNIINVSNTVILFGGGGISIMTPYGEGPSIDLTIASLRGAKIGVWWWNVRRNRLVCDESISKLLGIDPSKAVLTFEQFLDFIGVDRQDDLMDAIEESRKGNRMFRVSVTVRTPAGMKIARLIGRVFVEDGGEMASGVMFETDDTMETKFAP